MSNFIERVFSNHTLFNAVQSKKKIGKECKYFWRKYGENIAVFMVIVAIGVIILTLIVLIRQGISRNIAREATQYSYKVGQTAKCLPEAGVGEAFTPPGEGWVSCKILSVTPNHRYYTASYYNPNSMKLAIRKFSIQNIGIQ